MTRRHYIERILRQIYGTYVRDDSSITENLVNSWLNDGIAIAAKQNYRENIAIDGILFYLQESIFVFRLKQTHCIVAFAIERAIFKIHHVEFASFNFRMRAFVIELLGKVRGLFVEGFWIFEDLFHTRVHFVVG